jgi:hypothetical protein
MPTIETAAIAACVYAALTAGHHLGDHPVQPNSVAQAKGTPEDDRLAAGAHPWTGWGACARHVATYTLTQALALAVVRVVAPLTLAGVLAALAVSASTHAVIDRRWIVRAIIRVKQCQGCWPDGPYLIDQSLHHGVLLVAAVLGAAVTTAAGVAATTASSVGLVAGALAIERRRARSAPARIGDPFRL